MNYSANSCESSENENRDTPQQQIIEMGSTVVKNKRGTIHCLTIIGQVEGHTTLPPNVKTTKYEHVLPLLTSVEEKDDVIKAYLVGDSLKELEFTMGDLTDTEREIILKGCLINYYRG